MQKYTLTDQHGITWLRVSKLKARRAFELDKQVILCPNKLHPFNVWSSGVAVSRLDDKSIPFDKHTLNCTWYHCNKEGGLYLSYYVRA